MKVADFLVQPGAWLGDGEGVIVSSRIRLARNLNGTLFPGKANATERRRIWTELSDLLDDLPVMGHDLFSATMSAMTELERHLLFERHLVSAQHIEKRVAAGVVIRADERLSIMVNEEDHLRLQTLRPGLALREAWQLADRADTEIEERIAYAFHSRLGYLTACPTNVGTAMRASVMLHLPGLVMMKEMEPVIKGMSKIGLTVRGLWGEGSEALGNMFQISNQVTLGETEEHIIHNIETIAREVAEHEQHARERFSEKMPMVMLDHVWRAHALLSNARLLTSKEAFNLLSRLRLGIESGIVPKSRGSINELLIQVQPAHLQYASGRELDPRERDAFRAEWVRNRINTAGRDTSPQGKKI